MADTKDGNIFGIKPVVGSKSDNVSGSTAMSLLKKLVNKMGLGSYSDGFDSGFDLFRDDTAELINIIQSHNHNRERWFGVAAAPIGETHVADEMNGVLSAFRLTSGNSDFGAWVQIMGSEDTPISPGYTMMDVHEYLVTNVSLAGVYVVEVAAGEYADLPNRIANKEYTTTVYTASTTANDAGIYSIMSSRVPTGTKVWARVACVGQNAKTFDFYFGFHEYVY